MAENQTEDQTNRAKTIEEKIRERNQEKEAVSTHQYYGLALDLERKLVKMNLILTIISSVCMFFIVAYGLAIWNINYNMQLLCTEFVFFRIIISLMYIKRWVYLYKNKEASHPINSICMMGMFALVAVCMLMSQPPPDSSGAVMYIIVVTMIDIILLVVSAICIVIMKRHTSKLFFSQELFDNYVTSMSIKLLKILPIPVDMEGEYMHFKEEEELRRQQEKLKKSKSNPEPAPGAPGAPGAPAAPGAAPDSAKSPGS